MGSKCYHLLPPKIRNGAPSQRSAMMMATCFTASSGLAFQSGGTEHNAKRDDVLAITGPFTLRVVQVSGVHGPALSIYLYR